MELDLALARVIEEKQLREFGGVAAPHSAPAAGPEPKRAEGVCAWLPSALFFAVAFWHRVAPSTLTDELQEAFGGTAASVGALSSSYFVAYLATQLPVGVLLDRYGARAVLTASCAACTLGSFWFSAADSYAAATAARALVGGAAGASWIGALSVVAHTFEAGRAATMAGATIALGMCGALLAQAPLAAVAADWREAHVVAGLAGLALSAALWALTPVGHAAREHKEAEDEEPPLAWRDLLSAQVFFQSVYGLCVASALLAFVSLWAPKALEALFGYSESGAAAMASVAMLGWGFGAPVIGGISDWLGTRRWVLLVIAALGLAGMCLLLYVPDLPDAGVAAALLLLGFSSTAISITFTLVRETSQQAARGRTFALVNVSVIASGAIFQPVVGVLLDAQWDGEEDADGVREYSADAFRQSCSVFVVALAVCVGVALVFLRDGTVGGYRGSSDSSEGGEVESPLEQELA